MSMRPPGKSPVTASMFFSQARRRGGCCRAWGEAGVVQPAITRAAARANLMPILRPTNMTGLFVGRGRIGGMKGSVAYFYAFDVANEIRTSQVREVLSQKPFPYQIRLGAAAPRDVPVYSPLTIRLTPFPCAANVGAVSLQTEVKVFEIGALSISYEIAFDVPTLADLVPYHQFKVGDEPLALLAERLALQVADSIKEAMRKPNSDRPVVEAYTAFCVSDLGGVSVPDWVASQKEAIAGLLNEEPTPGKLARQQIEETFEQFLSYTRDDFAVIDWDAALASNAAVSVDDVLFMLELANLQLEEYKLLDDRLDR